MWIDGKTKIEYRYLNFDDEVLHKDLELALSDVDKMLVGRTSIQHVIIFSEDGSQCVKAYGTKRNPMGEYFNGISVRLLLHRMKEDGRIR